jgi:hypothetical protein
MTMKISLIQNIMNLKTVCCMILCCINLKKQRKNSPSIMPWVKVCSECDMHQLQVLTAPQQILSLSEKQGISEM